MFIKFKDFIALLSGFRKFTVMVLLILVGIVFRVLGYINGTEFVELLKSTAVAYMAFNGLEHMTGAVKDWIKNKI